MYCHPLTASGPDVSKAPVLGNGDSPLVVGCVGSLRGRQRIAHALKGRGTVLWHRNFSELQQALSMDGPRVSVVVLDWCDSTGAAATSVARAITSRSPGVGLVVYCPNEIGRSTSLLDLGAAGVHDIIVEDLTDDGHSARSIIMNARRRGAAEMVMSELRRILPSRLIVFADAVVRNPARSSVAQIAQIIGVNRQTPNLWCRKENYLRPELVLVWCRLILVAALLELTTRTIESISVELEYGSPSALRNQLKSYTSMTASEVRKAGMQKVIDIFLEKLAKQRSIASASVPERVPPRSVSRPRAS